MTEVTSAPHPLGDDAVVVTLASAPKRTKKNPTVDDADDEHDETRSVDSDDAGSLEEFIVDDEHDGEESEEEGSVASEPAPLTKDEERARDLDGIDPSNIVLGKRTRKTTQFYEQTVFNTTEYRKMMLDDVPPDEMHALESSDDDSDDEDDDDAAYEEDDEDEDEDNESEHETGMSNATPVLP